METNIFQKNEITKTSELIKSGKLVAFPTETVYGLGADATNEQAVKKVYEAKGRPSDNPLIVHVDGLEMVEKYAAFIPEITRVLASKYWPGPLTMILPLKENTLSSVVTGGLRTVAFRMPNNQATLALIKTSKLPLVGPSANTSGKPSPTTSGHVFHDLNGKIAGILEGGQSQIGVESTVLDLSIEGEATILRPGAITFEMLKEIIPNVSIDKHLLQPDEAPKAPGMKYTHYSPDVQVMMIDYQKENWQEAIHWAIKKEYKIGLLADEDILSIYESKANATYSLGDANDLVKATSHLFDGLRALDESSEKLDIIFAQTYPEKGIGTALMNRLKKAAGGHYFHS
ncbi:MAG: threonylcarbamoyl-AMP synthase [Streptococcaceae bacterium]|nr:threonylcarbamoyl-AMP synthase [Streptococcaceae bacterium]